jgi:pimeloyl-ACP methyl ester carboxylesterase
MSREAIVPVPGGHLFAVDEGDGPPVVLLHAGIVDLRAWDALVPLLVDRGLRVVRYDARGYGRSTTEDVEFSNRADLVAVLDACAIGRACLVGNSRGGMIALDTAAEHPERVAAIVLLGASIGGYDAPATAAEEALFAEMERLEEAGDPEATADFDVRLWVDGPGQPPDRVPAAIREAVRAMDLEVGDPTRARGRPIPLRPPVNDRLADLTMPILALAGALDVSDVWAAALRLRDACPDARAELVPGVAHLIAMEDPALVADRVADVVERAGPFS